MTGFVDLHCHMLCNTDDGAGSMEEMLLMLRQSYDDGIRTICLTPHYSPYIDFPSATETDKVFIRLRNFAKQNYPSMHLLRGNEIMYHNDIISSLNMKLCRTLNNTRYVLVEFNYFSKFETLLSGLSKILNSGYIPVLAHAERYPVLVQNVKNVYELYSRGIIIQLNARSVLGNNGWFIAKFCNKLIKNGLVDIIASDAHDPKNRPPLLSKCHDRILSLHGKDCAKNLMYTNPHMILHNEKLFR